MNVALRRSAHIIQFLLGPTKSFLPRTKSEIFQRTTSHPKTLLLVLVSQNKDCFISEASHTVKQNVVYFPGSIAERPVTISDIILGVDFSPRKYRRLADP